MLASPAFCIGTMDGDIGDERSRHGTGLLDLQGHSPQTTRNHIKLPYTSLGFEAPDSKFFRDQHQPQADSDSSLKTRSGGDMDEAINFTIFQQPGVSRIHATTDSQFAETINQIYTMPAISEAHLTLSIPGNGTSIGRSETRSDHDAESKEKLPELRSSNRGEEEEEEEDEEERDDDEEYSFLSGRVPSTKLSPGPGLGQTNRLSGLVKMSQKRHQILFDGEWAKVKRFRNEVWGLRSRMHEMRRLLKEEEQVKSIADNKYFQYLRMNRPRDPYGNMDKSDHGQVLEQLFRDCEIARNECGPLEDDCMILQDHIGSRELELQRLEEKLYERPLEHLVPQEQDRSMGDSVASSSYSGSDITQQYHPLVSSYLSKLGDVDILIERLDTNLEEKYILEEEKATRQRVGLDLAEASQIWLDGYLDLEAELMRQLEEAEAEAKNLKNECLVKGLVDQEGDPTDFKTQEQLSLSGEDVLSGSKTSEYVKYPLLIPHPAERRFRLKSPTLGEEALRESDNRVSKWLLDQLRESPLGVNLLASTFESQCGEINEETWQINVLEYWFTDVMGRS